MGQYTDAIITGLVITLISTLILFSLILKHMKDRRKWERIAEENYTLGRDEASQVLRETCDRIQENRNFWKDRTDRELLTELLLTLDSQSRRLDRMEDKLKTVAHYKSHIADMKGKTQQLTQSFLLLEQQTTTAAAAIGGLQQTVSETGAQLDAMVSELSGISRLHQAVGNYAAQLGGIELVLQELQEKADSIITDMESVMTTHDKSPEKRLKSIEMEITGLSLLSNAIADSVAELSASSQKLEQQLAVRSSTPDAPAAQMLNQADPV